MLRIMHIVSFCVLSLVLMADTLTGMCGDSLSWSFNTESGHLDITGQGKMNLFKYPAWRTKNISIHSVAFPNSIESIDSYAFEEQALTQVTIPASVKKFGRDCFVNNLALKRFTYEGTGYADTENGILRNCTQLRYFKGITRMLSYNDVIDTIIITYGYAVTSWQQPTYIDNTHAYDTHLHGEYDETPKRIRTFFFPDKLEVIGDFFLCNAPHLGGISIPATVVSIGKGAFLNCPSMDSLVFRGEAIQTIGDSAFYNCSHLKYIRIADSIPPTIAAHTFLGVDHSIPVYVPQGASENYKEAAYWSEFFYFVEPTTTDLVDIHPSSENSLSDFKEQKILYNNQILIRHHEDIYSINGQKITQSNHQ